VRVGRTKDVEDSDVRGRRDRARANVDARRYDASLADYVWLWERMLEFMPSMLGVRSSFMAGEMGELAAAHEPARTRFRELRDRAAASDRGDWVVLNEVVGDEDLTIGWIDQLLANGERMPRTCQRRATELLRSRGRVADVGRVVTDPLRDARFAWEMRERMLGMAERFDGHHRDVRERYRTSIAQLDEALRAAGRVAEADAVRDEALRLDDSPEMRAALTSSS
jgi:hypothetical protein